MNSPREVVMMKTKKESLIKTKTLALLKVKVQINSLRSTWIGSVVKILDKTLPKILRGKDYYLMMIT